MEHLWQFVMLVPQVLLSTLVAHLLILTTRFILDIYRMHKATADIPGPNGTHITRLWKSRTSVSKASDLFLDVLNSHKPVFKFWSGPYLFVVISDVNDIEFALTSKKIANKSIVYNILKTMQGVGLINLNGKEWRRHRKIVSPFLHTSIVRDFVGIFHEKSMVLARRLESLADEGTSFNAYPYISLAINDMLCATVMSTNMDSQKNEEREFSLAIERGLHLMTYRIFYPWFVSDAVFSISKYKPEFEKCRNIFHNFTERMLAAKRKERLVQSLRGDNTIDHSKKKRTFLDMMLDSPEDCAFTDKELIDEAKTLVTAASGGSSDVLSFTLLCMALRQDIQQKVVQELDDIFAGDSDRITTEDDLRHMEYLERVIKEVLRIFPSIPCLGRTVAETVQLPSGYKVPAGAQIIMYILGPQRDPKLFPDPLHFDPDRFLPENQAGRHPYSFVPFSVGQRNCIGQKYAMMQIKTTVSVLLRYYRVLPGERAPRTIRDIKINLAVTLSSRSGYNCILRKRRSLPQECSPIWNS